MALWARGFRPLFLLAGVWGCVSPIAWVAMLCGCIAPPAWLSPVAWHAHEMLFGVVAAAVAGFLLTSVPVWTDRPPVAGRPLAALTALWIAGRLAMLGAASLAPIAVAASDLAFLLALVVCLAPPLLAGSQRRNWGIVAILLGLCGANARIHAEAVGWGQASAETALRFAVQLVVVLLVVIGGRITPAFTRNAFARAGIEAPVRSSPGLDRWAIALVCLLPASELLWPRTSWSGGVALAAALAVAGRMRGWQTLRTWRDPLLWSLHAGYAWVCVGLVLVAVADLGRAVPWTAGLHALTAGAMGSMMLAVMTRVALGHTGRPLVAPRGVVAVFGLVHAGALVRLGAAFAPGISLPLLTVAGVLWGAAFGLFVALYAPILTRPRVDGAPG